MLDLDFARLIFELTAQIQTCLGGFDRLRQITQLLLDNGHITQNLTS
jgi:hypothetical protein